jgi:hypothetical protein
MSKQEPFEIGDTVSYRATNYSAAETLRVVGIKPNGGITLGWMDGANITRRVAIAKKDLWKVERKP